MSHISNKTKHVHIENLNVSMYIAGCTYQNISGIIVVKYTLLVKYAPSQIRS